MTVKQIADAVGKDDRSVQRWVKSLSDKITSINDKMSLSSPMRPADYTLEEVCEIIKEGLGVSVADTFKTNAVNAQKKNSNPKDYKNLAELRKAFTLGLISKEEFRIGIGLDYPQAYNLDPQIAKQVYAVACKAIEKKKIEESWPKLID